MRHKVSNPIIIKGKHVILSEVLPEYFEYIILWRNNKRLNKYINQSFELTIDSQYKWYREKYLVDPTQAFFVMLEKATNRPFATIGWTYMDVVKKQCVGGRLLMPLIHFLCQHKTVPHKILRILFQNFHLQFHQYTNFCCKLY